MKKTILACALLGAFSFTSAQAATLVGFKVGGDYWQADTSGTIGGNGQPQQDYNYSSSSQGSIWMAVEHPIPLVPNIKIRENFLDASGRAAVGNATVTNKVDLSNTDFVLYYELLDNDLVALDLGAAYKLMHGSFRGTSSEKDLNSGIVMMYADAQVGISGIGLYGFADIMIGLNESKVYDYTLGLGWQLEGVALDYQVRAGFREFNFDVNDFDGVTANTQFSGFFAGVELVF